MQLPGIMRRAAVVLLAVACFAAVPTLEVSALETVSEISSNASIGDLNGDGLPDIVLVKGGHWQVATKIFFGAGRGHDPNWPTRNAAAGDLNGELRSEL